MSSATGFTMDYTDYFKYNPCNFCVRSVVNKITLLLLSTSLLQAQTVVGYADVHNHQFANLAFGKKVCSGEQTSFDFL